MQHSEILTATVFDIQRNSYVDGPGIRTTVFFKGCNLHCAWCHNPESQCAAPQMLFYKNKCTGCGKCKEKCPNALETCDLCGKCTMYCPHDAREICGKEYTMDEMLREIVKDKAFYDNSGGGVTFSGGECMLYPDFLAEILAACRSSGIHTAVDTAGNVPFSHFEQVMPYTDLFLYDIKAFSGELHRSGTGVENNQILENLTRLSKGFPGDILIRVPVIPGFNADPAEMGRIATFLASLGLSGTELLPYHRLGEHKYAALGQAAPTYRVPTDEEMTAFRTLFVQ
ncbi:MAG: glycyl-radical enzyme activating protein [Ruminococcaceae bacterium]|nr:glycyl-radical enzyme activating protein [Oscillospiraceae bacterium]